MYCFVISLFHFCSSYDIAQHLNEYADSPDRCSVHGYSTDHNRHNYKNQKLKNLLSYLEALYYQCWTRLHNASRIRFVTLFPSQPSTLSSYVHILKLKTSCTQFTVSRSTCTCLFQIAFNHLCVYHNLY